MENHAYGQIIGSSDAPYLNKLAGQAGLATNFYAEAHPSLPNYIAMTSGSTQGITDDNPPADHPLERAEHLQPPARGRVALARGVDAGELPANRLR